MEYSTTIGDVTQHDSEHHVSLHVEKSAAATAQETGIGREDRSGETRIPLAVFRSDAGPLQALVTYLHEEQGYGFTEIGELLDRDPRTIWSAYDQCDASAADSGEEDVRLTALVRDELTILQSLVFHLKATKTYQEIADLLDKHYQTVWTVHRRAEEKLEVVDDA